MIGFPPMIKGPEGILPPILCARVAQVRWRTRSMSYGIALLPGRCGVGQVVFIKLSQLGRVPDKIGCGLSSPPMMGWPSV
ncbi:hypothetical protein LINPERHAP2_LOCUS33675 [Linum perenne]